MVGSLTPILLRVAQLRLMLALILGLDLVVTLIFHLQPELLRLQPMVMAMLPPVELI